MSLIRRSIMLIVAFAVFGMPAVARADFAAYSAEVLADSPVVYLHLDETSGTLAADASGNGNTGTFTGGFSLDGTGAMVGSASPSFDGSTGFVNLPGTWGGGSTVTVECWANLNGLTGTWQAMISSLDGTFVHFQTHTGGNNVAYTIPGRVSLAIIPSSPLGSWRYLVMVIESGNSRIYIDGSLFSSSTQTFTTINQTNTIRVGSGFASSRFFNGSIDEVAIYNTALSATRVQEHYDAAIAAPLILGEIPTLSDWGAGLFILLLAAAGVFVVRFALR